MEHDLDSSPNYSKGGLGNNQGKPVMEEQNEGTPTEAPQPGARSDLSNKSGLGTTLPPDLDAFTHEQRIDYIMNVRRRVDEDDTKVSDDEIRNAVCLIRLTRADVAKTRRSKKDTGPKISLADF